jgi:hypothetical protein
VTVGYLIVTLSVLFLLASFVRIHRLSRQYQEAVKAYRVLEERAVSYHETLKLAVKVEGCKLFDLEPDRVILNTGKYLKESMADLPHIILKWTDLKITLQVGYQPGGQGLFYDCLVESLGTRSLEHTQITRIFHPIHSQSTFESLWERVNEIIGRWVHDQDKYARDRREAGLLPKLQGQHEPAPQADS